MLGGYAVCNLQQVFSVLDCLFPLLFYGRPVTFAEVTSALHNRVTLPASAPWALYWLTSGLRVPADSSFCPGFLFFPGSPLCPLQKNLRKPGVTRKLIYFNLSMIPSVSSFPLTSHCLVTFSMLNLQIPSVSLRNCLPVLWGWFRSLFILREWVVFQE